MLPENGGISSSSSPIPDPAPPKANSLETELLCDESFSEIIKEEVEEEVVSSDSLNERKRLRTVEEEEDATEAVSDSNKSRRIHEEEEEEKGQNEIDEQNGNQDSEQSGNQESEVADEKDGGNEENNKEAEESEQKEGAEDGENGDKEEEEKETEGGNQENNNGEEDQNEEDETEEVEKEDETEEVEKEDETEELPQFSTAEEEGEKHNLEEHRENVGGEDNVNRVNSKQNEEEEKETEEQKQKAAEKGKRPLFEESEEDEEEEQKQQAAKKWQKTSLIPITPIFSKFLRGESSHRTKGDQIQKSTPKVDTELVDIEINTDNNKGYDYHRDLAILKAMYDFKFINGYLPYPHSDELHNHIMDLMPDLNILGNDLTVKITAFEDDFNTVIILDGDNPEMAQPVEREIFDLSMQLWGNSDDNVGDGI